MAAHDREQELEGGDDAEQRIARARATIGKSFEELISRTERQAAELGSLPPAAPAEPAPAPPVPAPPGDPGGHPDALALAAVEERIERRLAAESAAIEARVGEWVNARVQAAERRLELQSAGLEASLGQGTSVARDAVERLERMQADVAASAAEAIAAVGTAVETARSDLGLAVGERAESIGDVEARIAASEADFGAKLASARAELEAAFTEAVETRQNDSIERVEAILIRQSEQGSERVSEAHRADRGAGGRDRGRVRGAGRAAERRARCGRGQRLTGR